MTLTAPLLVATDWGSRGAVAVGALLAVVAIGSCLYWRMLARRRQYRLPAILLWSSAAVAIAWFSPVLFSSDVYAYAAYGEMARTGFDPYVRAPAAAHDLLVRAAQVQWITAFPICVYGPAFLALARAIVTIFAPFGMLAQLEAFRAFASASLLCCAMLAYAAYPGDRVTRLRAAATIALNPVNIWCAAEGHNDALALAVLLGGFALVRAQRMQIGAAIVALSALIKAPGLAAAAALAIVNARARAGAMLGIAVTALFSIPLIEGVATQLAPRGAYAPQASLQAIVAPLGASVALTVAIAAAAVLAARGLKLLRRRSDEGWIWLGLGAWMLVPNPYPWYALWLVALAALAPRTRAGTVAILLSLTSLLRYVPDAIGLPSGALAVALGVAAALPLVGLVPLRRWYNHQLA